MSKKAVAVVLFVFVLLGCRRELDPPSWDIDALVPLAYTELSIFSAIEDSLLNTSGQGALELHYTEELIKFELDSLLQIPDTNTIESFSLPIGTVTVPPGQSIFSDTIETVYDLSGAELRYAIIRSGTIEVTLSNTLEEAVVFEYTLPNVELNGNPFEVIETVPAASGNSTSSITRVFDLSGYRLDLTGRDGNQFNTLLSQYDVYTDPTGNSTLLTSQDFVEINTTYQSIIPAYAKGYFSDRTEKIGPERTGLEAFNSIRSGTVALDEATLQLTIENEIGADFSMVMPTFRGLKTTTGSQVDVSHAITSSPVQLTRAKETVPESNYEARSYQTQLDASNSNITDFIGIFPDSVEYVLDLAINPLGNISGGNDFIFYNTGVTVTTELSIPLRFSANRILIADTTEFQLDNDSRAQTDNIQGGTLWLRGENDYPLEAEMQLVLIDSLGTVLDTLVGMPNTVAAALVGADGRTIEPAVSRIAIPIDDATIPQMYAANRVIILATLTTVHSEPIVIYDDYRLTTKLIGDFEYRVDTDDF